jgi:hypothetical protein
MTLYQAASEFMILPRDEFEARYGALPAAFTADTVVLDFRPDLAERERLLVTGQPRREAMVAELELQKIVVDQVLEQNSREVRWIFLLYRLLKEKFGNRAELERLMGDVRDEAEAIWRVTEASEPPIPRDATFSLPWRLPREQ